MDGTFQASAFGAGYGEKIKCPKCGAEGYAEYGFCGQCGEPLKKPLPQQGAFAGAAMGDKNVIAGDVTFSTVNTVTDETKSVRACAVCGKNIPALQGFNCAKCGRFVCQLHYNALKLCCAGCAEGEREKSAALVASYEKIVFDFFSKGVVTPQMQSQMLEARIANGVSDEEAAEVERKCLEMRHVVKQVGVEAFVALGEKSSVAVSNCAFAFDQASFRISAQSIANKSSWRTGNLALSVWFSPKGLFGGDLSGCVTMEATDLPSFAAGATLNNISRVCPILNNPPSGTYTPFFAVGEKFSDGMKVIAFGNFAPMNWNQR